MIVGKQSILFEENVYIEETACVAGQKESEGPLGKLFDVVVEDAMAGHGKLGRSRKYLTAAGCG